jgi:PKD repeat protein
MRQFLKIIFVFTILLVVESCEKNPIKVSACFSINKPYDKLFVGDTIRFDGGCSKNTKLFFWNFGDCTGVYKTKVVLHSFAQKRNYTVTLKVVDGIDTMSTAKQLSFF